MRRLRPAVELLVGRRADVADPEVAASAGRTRTARGCGAPCRPICQIARRAERIDPQQLAERGCPRFCAWFCGSPSEVSPGGRVASRRRPCRRTGGPRGRTAAGRPCGSDTAGRRRGARRALDGSADAVRRGGTRRRGVSPVRSRVVDVEEVVLRVARVERHREEPALAAARHAIADVEERARDPAVAHHHDPSRAARRRRASTGRRAPLVTYVGLSKPVARGRKLGAAPVPALPLAAAARTRARARHGEAEGGGSEQPAAER